MTDNEIFDLEPDGAPNRFRLRIDSGLCVGMPGHRIMFGGVGIGASVAALSRALGRDPIWATAHFLSVAKEGACLQLEVETLHASRNVAQARLTARMGDNVAFMVSAAAGAYQSDMSRQWRVAPDVPPPEDTPVLEGFDAARDDFHSRLETRRIKGHWGIQNFDKSDMRDDGHALFWVWRRDGGPVTPAMVAMTADYVPGAAGPALGVMAGANSLDLTLRLMNHRHETDWVLVELQMDAAGCGILQGGARLYARDGVLLGTSTQTGAIRIVRPGSTSEGQLRAEGAG